MGFRAIQARSAQHTERNWPVAAAPARTRPQPSSLRRRAALDAAAQTPTGPRPGGSALPSPIVRIARRQHRARRRQVAGVVVVAQQLAVERVVVAVEQVLDA